MPSGRHTTRWFARPAKVAVTVGLASSVFPIPGALTAALVLPAGIHSSAPTGFVILTFVFNFVLVAGLAYLLMKSYPR